MSIEKHAHIVYNIINTRMILGLLSYRLHGEKGNIMVKYILRSDLVINSKRAGVEFLDGIKGVVLVPVGPVKNFDRYYLRVEPGRRVSFIRKSDIDSGAAAFIPASLDDGSMIWRFRKWVNAWLLEERLGV